MKIVLILALVILLVIVGPLITIWAMNTLFPVLAIPTTLKTWFAVIVLFGAVSSSTRSGK